MNIIDRNLKLFIKKQWNDPSFIELDAIEVTNIRSEDYGLGAATVSVKFNKYDQTVIDSLKTGPTTILKGYVNYFAFIVDTNLIPAKNINDPTYGDDYTLASNHEPEIVWFGYVSDETIQIQARSGDFRGDLSLLEIGHYINKSKIRYTLENSQGFNPVVSNIIVGNKDNANSLSEYSTYEFQRIGRLIARDITLEPDKYWKVQEVIGYILIHCIENDTIKVLPDWSKIDQITEGGRNGWLVQPETFPSFAGENLTSALNKIQDSLTWTYLIDKNDALTICFKERTRGNTTIVLDNSCEDFYIMNEEQAYNKITLRGDRILCFNTITSYTPTQYIGLQADWTSAEMYKYLQPYSDDLNEWLNYDNLVKSITLKLSNKTGGLANGENDTSLQVELEKALGQYEAAREQWKHVYRRFKLGYCDPNDPSESEGECLATYPTPGKYATPADSNNSAEVAIPMYPYVNIQDSDALDNVTTYDEASDTTTMLSTPYEVVNLDPKIDLTLLKHQTPTPVEMKYFDYLADDTGINTELQPKMWYRSLGRIMVFKNDGTRINPLWIDGSKSGQGLASIPVEFEMDMVKIDTPVAEILASPCDDLFQDLQSDGTYNTTIVDFGKTRTEWKDSPNNGATPYDPWLRKHTYRSIGHWSRFVISAGSYSNQRLEFSYGYAGPNNITIDDETFGMTLINQGYVYQTAPGPTVTYASATDKQQAGKELNWNAEAKIIRNDTKKMGARMQTLWDYYSKTKRAVKLTFALSTVDKKINNPIGKPKLFEAIGEYISYIQESNGKQYAVNAAISSIEYDNINSRILIQTSIPAGPARTRNRIVRSIFKDTKASSFNKE